MNSCDGRVVKDELRKEERGGGPDEYADIIEHQHYEPKHHPRMSREARAAQFAPFAALKGYDEMVEDLSQDILI